MKTINIAATVVALVLFAALPAAAQSAEDQAGEVVRLQGQAVAMQDAFPRILKLGDPIYVGDVISTGKGARIEVRLMDDSIMTLGERTVFTVTDFVNTEEQNKAALRLLSGSFKAVSGTIAQVASASFVVETPVATIGIRGTTFWGGSLDGEFEVALLDGKGLYIENKAGRVEITTVGQGTKIGGTGVAPTQPVTWAKSKVDRAVATVTFR